MSDYSAAIQGVAMPARIRSLPVSPKGYPVPWFVETINGMPDFRVIRRGAIAEAHRYKRCWICGQPLGRYLAVVVGPMCTVNRVSSEPASHRDCGTYSAIACPFLSNPRMRRREAGLPDNAHELPGVALKRNPGACAVWITESVKPFKVGDGVLFRIGDPIEVLWYAEGRTATRAEVMASIDSGLPLLEEQALAQGPEAFKALRRETADALRYLPA